HLVGPAVLDALGPSGVLVNIARGTTVDEAALAAALRGGRLAGAALDVFEHEPAVHQDLLRLGASPKGEPPYVVLMPHTGGWSTRSFREMSRVVLENLDAVLAGRPPVTPVPEMAVSGVGVASRA
ncbi:hypothetical protein HK405_016003, partial [Cladochytrium tenue]